MKLIDKDILVAEINRNIKNIYAGREYVGIPDDEGYIVKGLIIAKGIINSLEVKEIDLEKEIDEFINTMEIWEIQEAPLTSIENASKHFFELGIKVQKGE